MLRAIDAANFFILLFNSFEEDNDLTNMKINKLLYYAQGHSYERFGRALFNDNIEAWQNGPVVNGVYQNLKKYESHIVSGFIGSDFDASKIDDDEAELLLDVAREYGKYSANELKNMTHIPEGPWDRNYVPGQYHTIIPQQDIAESFMLGNKLPEFKINPDIETIGYVDNNCLVLSKEDVDDWDY